MTAHHASGMGEGAEITGTWRSVVAWVLAIGGTVSAFMGLFILLASEDQYVGIGGDWSWRVGDITPEWGIGLLIGGIAALLILGVWTLARRR
ncbi:MAG: hypothetical protein ABFS21_10605 [Actinomycetota bacterium]